jgi:hypothetical protein
MVGREVHFLAVCPIHADELELARKSGTRELLAAFARHGLDPEIVDSDHPSLA